MCLLSLHAQSAVCACKQLRALILSPLPELTMGQSESRLLQNFVALLPELRAISFNMAR